MRVVVLCLVAGVGVSCPLPRGWCQGVDVYADVQGIPQADLPAALFQPPFLHLVGPPGDDQRLEDPESYIRWAVMECDDEHCLAAVRTPGGTCVSRVPHRGIIDPPDEAWGRADREQNGRAATFLEALSPDDRAALASGATVNLSAHSADLRALLARDGEAYPADQFLDGAPRVVARLYPVPILNVEAPGDARCEVQFINPALPPSRFRAVQCPEAGAGTLWDEMAARKAQSLAAGLREWESASAGVRGPSPSLEALLAAIASGLPPDLQSIPLDDVNGYRLDELLAELARAAGVEVRTSGSLCGFYIHAVGPAVPAAELLRALTVAGWLGVERRMPGDPPTVFHCPSLADRWTAMRSSAALNAPDAGIRGRMAEFTAMVTSDATYARLPIRVERFIEWWSGSLSDLDDAEAAWVRATVSQWARPCEIIGLDEAMYGWLKTCAPAEFTLTARFDYTLIVGVCVPYQEYDKDLKRWLPAPVPDRLYDEFGASRDLPVYSVLTAQYHFR